MTPATPTPKNRHDTLFAVTSKGTDRHSIRMDDPLWAKLGEQAAAAKSDRSAVLRDFARWFVGEEGAELPQRPSREGQQ